MNNLDTEVIENVSVRDKVKWEAPQMVNLSSISHTNGKEFPTPPEDDTSPAGFSRGSS